jgi:archaemetzincin
VGPIGQPVIAAIGERITEKYDADVDVLPEMPVPDGAFDAGRKQFSSSVILQRLAGGGPTDAYRLFGVTECDLFIPMLSFVFGQAQLNGRVALLSLARLQQEFYGLPGDATVLIERAIKETLHELGHTFGLLHCLDKECPMSLSTTVQLLDNKRSTYCAGCSALLRDALVPGRMENDR